MIGHPLGTLLTAVPGLASSHIQEGLTNLVLNSILKTAPDLASGHTSVANVLAARGMKAAGTGIDTRLRPRQPGWAAPARDSGEAATRTFRLFEDLVVAIKSASADNHARFAAVTGTRVGTFDRMFVIPAWDGFLPEVGFYCRNYLLVMIVIPVYAFRVPCFQTALCRSELVCIRRFLEQNSTFTPLTSPRRAARPRDAFTPVVRPLRKKRFQCAVMRFVPTITVSAAFVLTSSRRRSRQRAPPYALRRRQQARTAATATSICPSFARGTQPTSLLRRPQSSQPRSESFSRQLKARKTARKAWPPPNSGRSCHPGVKVNQYNPLTWTYVLPGSRRETQTYRPPRCCRQ